MARTMQEHFRSCKCLVECFDFFWIRAWTNKVRKTKSVGCCCCNTLLLNLSNTNDFLLKIGHSRFNYLSIGRAAIHYIWTNWVTVKSKLTTLKCESRSIFVFTTWLCFLKSRSTDWPTEISILSFFATLDFVKLFCICFIIEPISAADEFSSNHFWND